MTFSVIIKQDDLSKMLHRAPMNKAPYKFANKREVHYSACLVISHCALCRKDSCHMLVCGFCVSSKGGTGGGG